MRAGANVGRVSDETMPVAEAVADLLAACGVRRAYTVPGESFLPLLEAIDSHPQLQLVSTRHEGGAAFMAEADGRLTGRPAVVMATRAVGTANLAIGIHTARQDSTPMLALLGQVETQFLGNEAFQEVDLPAFLREITVWAATVQRPDRVVDTVARALARATTGRPGPVAVALPADVLEAEGPAGRPLLGAVPQPVASPDDVGTLAWMLGNAERPVIVAGQESDHEALVALARAYGAGVYVAFRRQDAYPNDDEHYLGHLGLGNPSAVLAALERADLVLVLGERLDEITTQGFRLPLASSAVVHVHRDPAVLGVHRAVNLALVADPARLCRDLVALAPQENSTREPWWREGHAAHLAAAAAAAAPDPAARLHPGRVVAAVQAVAPAGTVVVNDAGNHSQFLHRQWCFTEPATQAAPISGAMGYAVPGGIGAALASPDRTVLAFAGDGGFLMTATELETAARLGVQTKFLVLQNGLHGTIAMHQARAGHGLGSSRISGVDIPALSSALGVPARGIDAEDELADAARWLLGQEGPALLCVRTDPDVVSPGTSLSELAGG